MGHKRIRFVNPKNDVAFKKIFGSEEKKEILISFLNAVLDLKGDRAIQRIELLNPYQTPKLETLKYTILDIRATDQRGVTFIVEMQVEHVPGFEKRVLYYTSRAYVGQLQRGQDYPRLNQVIFIGILDFVAFEGEDYITRHLIQNQANGRQELKDMEFNFIELPKFKRGEDELETVLDKWIYFIKHASDLEMVPENADFPALQAAYEVANTFGWSEEDLEMYENRGIKIQDERGALQLAEERGVRRGTQEGLQKGLQKGRQEGLQDVARTMLSDGVAPALVAKYTGLSVDEVGSLVEEMTA